MKILVILLAFLINLSAFAQSFVQSVAFKGASVPIHTSPAGFTYYSVLLNGSTGYYSRGGDVTGMNDGSEITVSFWAKGLAPLSATYMWGQGTFGTSLDIYWASETLFRVRAVTSTPTTIATIEFSVASSMTNTWDHFLISIKAGSTCYIYTNDVLAGSVASTAGIMELTTGAAMIGRSVPAFGWYPGYLSEFWLSTNALDITDVNVRRKFISASHKPVDLGTDGSTPTGTQPAVYLHSQYPNWGNNLGFGGNFTKSATGVSDGGSDIP